MPPGNDRPRAAFSVSDNALNAHHTPAIAHRLEPTRNEQSAARPQTDPDSGRGRPDAGHRLHVRRKAVVGFDLFSHFRLQYLIVALLLSGAALAIGARPTAVVVAIVALVLGWAIKDLWWGGTASAGLDGVPLRVVSANVQSQNPAPEKGAR